MKLSGLISLFQSCYLVSFSRGHLFREVHSLLLSLLLWLGLCEKPLFLQLSSANMPISKRLIRPQLFPIVFPTLLPGGEQTPINWLPPASHGKTLPTSAKSLLRQPLTFCVGQSIARERKSNQSHTATASAREFNCMKYRFIHHQRALLGCGPWCKISCKQRHGSAKCCRKLQEAESQHFPWKQQLPGKVFNAPYLKTVIPAPSAPPGGFGT